MYLELSKDDHTKDYAKSIRSLRKIIKNHPYTSSAKFSSLEWTSMHVIFCMKYNHLMAKKRPIMLVNVHRTRVLMLLKHKKKEKIVLDWLALMNGLKSSFTLYSPIFHVYGQGNGNS